VAVCQLLRNDKGHVVAGESSQALQGEPV
ncbi:MAG: hypothetical protein ACJAQZ_005109, partial [Planctomycetota bacterium]